MSAMNQRSLIYIALAILCASAGSFVGLAAAVWSFIQIVAVIELTYWIGTPGSDSARSW